MKTTILLSIVCVLAALSAYGQDSAPTEAPPAETGEVPPAETAPAPDDTAVTLVEMTGSVEVRESADKPWIKAKPGMKLSSSWEISTGLRGKAVLKFADNSTVLVQRLTEMKISEFSRSGGEVKTRLNMKYGAVRVHVKKGTARNDFQVSSPTATASVKGTIINEFTYFKGLGGKIQMGPEGSANYGQQGFGIPVGPGQGTNDKLLDPIISAKMKTWVPVTFTGFTQGENKSAVWHGTPGSTVWKHLAPTNNVGPGKNPPMPVELDLNGHQGPPDTNGNGTTPRHPDEPW
jgi:hypothetical protein